MHGGCHYFTMPSLVATGELGCLLTVVGTARRCVDHCVIDACEQAREACLLACMSTGEMIPILTRIHDGESQTIGKAFEQLADGDIRRISHFSASTSQA